MPGFRGDPKLGVWHSLSHGGRDIPVRDMADGHLQNAISWLRRFHAIANEDGKTHCQEWQDVLQAEGNRRAASDKVVVGEVVPFREGQAVRLLDSWEAWGLVAGTVGTVVHIHGDGRLEVDFAPVPQGLRVVTVAATQVQPVVMKS